MVEFSEVYKHSGYRCESSPNGEVLAVAVDHRLIIRDSVSQQILQIFSCDDKIDQIAWASDSKYILSAVHSCGLVQVWDIDDPEWSCRLNEGSSGLVLILVFTPSQQ